MAACNIIISFDASQLVKLIRTAEYNVFLYMHSEFEDMEKVLNINNIINSDDLTE